MHVKDIRNEVHAFVISHTHLEMGCSDLLVVIMQWPIVKSMDNDKIRKIIRKWKRLRSNRSAAVLFAVSCPCVS